MKLLQKAEIEGVDLVYLPFSLLRDAFGDAADATLTLHDRRRRLALLDLRPPSRVPLASSVSGVPAPAAGDVYDDSTIDDDDDDETDVDHESKLGSTASSATTTTTSPTTTTTNTTNPSTTKKTSKSFSDSTTAGAAAAATAAVVTSDAYYDNEDNEDEHVSEPAAPRRRSSAATSDADSSPRANKPRITSARTGVAPEDLTLAVSSDGGDSLTSLTANRGAHGAAGGGIADDDDDWPSSQSSSSRRGRYRTRNGPRDPLTESPPTSGAPSPRITSASARSLMSRTNDIDNGGASGTGGGGGSMANNIKTSMLMRSASDSMTSAKSAAPAVTAAPVVASLDRRKQHKLQQLLGDEVALANHSTSSATELAIQHVVETVAGIGKLQLRQPWRTFLVSDDLVELEAPRDGNAQEKTPIAKLKVLRTARYILFSDILLRCWPTATPNKHQLHDTVSLDSVLLVDLDASGDNRTFQIVVMGGLKGSEKLTLRTRTSDEKREWMHYLNGIIDRKLSTQMRSYKATQASVLVDDQKSPRRVAALLGLPQLEQGQQSSGSEVRKVRRRRRAEDSGASAPHSPRSPRALSPRSPRSRSPRSRSPPGSPPRSPRLRHSRSKSPPRSRREGAISALLRPLRRGRSNAEFSLRVAPVDANEVPTARRECTVCRSWLSGNLLVVNGFYYHHDCLLCTSCHIVLSPGTCYLDPSSAASPAPSVQPADANRVPSLLCSGCFARLMKRTRRSSERDRGWMAKATSPESLSHAILQQTTGGTPVGDVVAARRHAKLQRMLDDKQPAVRRRDLSQPDDDDDNGFELDTEDLVDLDALPNPDDSTDSDLSSDEPTTSTNSRSSSVTRRLRTTRLPSQTTSMTLGDESDEEEASAQTPTMSHTSRSRG